MVGETKIVRASVCALLLWSGVALAEDRVTGGAASVEPPTLISLGFDWTITGDDNRNAAVTVEYREAGAADWHVGLPLMRLMNEQVNGRVGGPSYLPGTNAAESAATLAGGTAPPPIPGSSSNPFAFSPFSYTAPNMFSGSVFDLKPGTQYEIRLSLRDPDGVDG